MSEPTSGKVRCEKCLGAKRVPVLGCIALRTCDRCKGEGWLTESTPAAQTPEHYQSPSGTTPWDLQRGMKSSGNAFVDGRRCDAIKYAFRVKQNMAEDLRKAAHCLMEAVAVLEAGGDKSAAVDRILSEVFDEKGVPKFHYEPLGVYNDWEFWKDARLWNARCLTHYRGVLCSPTKKDLFDNIDADNATIKQANETPL